MLFTGSEKYLAIISSNILSPSYISSLFLRPQILGHLTLALCLLFYLFFISLFLGASCWILPSDLALNLLILFLTMSNLLLKSIHWLSFFLVPSFKADHFPCCSLLGGLAALFLVYPCILSLCGLVGFQLYWGFPLCFLHCVESVFFSFLPSVRGHYNQNPTSLGFRQMSSEWKYL